MLLPGIAVTAVMLAAMIVHMETVFALFSAKPVFSLYPHSTDTAIFFPHVIEGTSLIAERMAAYDGPFVEDGSNAAATGIAALVLHNGGTQPLSHIRVELRQKTRCLIFEAQTLLPGDTVMILEKERQLHEQSPYSSCRGDVTIDDSTWLETETVRVTVLKENELLVQNQSNRYLHNVCLEHKRWMEETGIYIGGITYVTWVGDLAPGQHKTVFADNFTQSTHRFVRITCS